ncbi:RDD family protein [Tessaracoccus sp. SD287]|uniref:RDD family protein n=1 Tax=Tessaracoccus sp. SD287 TaxID=2782008 RepID=UPI001A975160|nr:RDD family protein [Tessaracoccus sp. SD287]MBO1029843.1 RDD family protein [Tessaracoccus sp. SD287]
MSNNWNDPNAPQGDNNQGGWQHQPEQNWDQGQAPADPTQPPAEQNWDQGQQAGGWDQQGQPSANQGWDQQGQPSANQGWDQSQGQQGGGWDQQGQPSANQGWDQSQGQQPGGWDQQGQPSANQGWDQSQGQQPGGWDQQGQLSANQGWDQSQGQQAGGWDQAQGAAYGAPGAGAPGYGTPGYGTPGYGAPGYGAPGYSGQPMAPGAKIGPLGMPLASWGKRALGGLLDFVLPGFIISLLLNIIFPAEVNTSGGVSVSQTNNLPSLIGSLLLYLALAFVSQKTGQSWGRKVAKTQLVGEDGRPIGLGKSFVRYLAHYIDSLICLVGWLFPLWDNKRQTIADKIMKTYVLDVSQSGPINVQQ